MTTRQLMMELIHPAALLYLFTKPASSHYREEMKTKVGRGETKAKVCQGGGRDERRGGTRGGMENFENKKVGEEARKAAAEQDSMERGPVPVFLAPQNFCSAVCFFRSGS